MQPHHFYGVKVQSLFNADGKYYSPLNNNSYVQI